MDGEARRQEIMKILALEKQPVAGTELAGRLGVSRQVIVQDIALLRAIDKNILSTNKGYLLFQEQGSAGSCKRVYKVKHDEAMMREELYLIVDCGGQLLNVVVEHPIYGQIMADLVMQSRQDVDNFVRQVEEYRIRPLNALTDGLHYHAVQAKTEEILDLIEKKLREKGILVS